MVAFSYGSPHMLWPDQTGFGEWYSYYIESARVWDDVVLTAWYYGEDSTVKLSAVRYNADMTLTQGSVETMADAGGTYSGTITWMGRLADGVALVVVGEVYSYTPGVNTDEPVIAFAVQVNPTTLALTMQRVDVPWGFLNADHGYMSEYGDRVLVWGVSRWTFTNVEDYHALGSITWNGSAPVANFVQVLATGSPDPGATISAWVDLGDGILRIQNTTSTNVEFRIFSRDSNGLPTGTGTVALNHTKVSTDWNISHVYTVLLDTGNVWIAKQNNSGTLTVLEFDTTAHTLTTRASLLTGYVNSSRHQDDWVSIERVPDLPGHVAVFWGSSSYGGIRAALIGPDGTRISEGNVWSFSGTLSAQRNVTGTYLGGGKFVITATVETDDAAAWWLTPVAIAGQFEIAVPQLWVNLSTEYNNPNWVEVCPDGKINTSQTDTPNWVAIHQNAFQLNVGDQDNPSWMPACNH